MTASVRFLGAAVFAWAGVRAVSLGIVPVGNGALAIDRPDPSPSAQATLIPPIERTEFAPIDPPADALPADALPADAPVSALPLPPAGTRIVAPPRPGVRYASAPTYVPVYVDAGGGQRQSRARYRPIAEEPDLPPPPPDLWLGTADDPAPPARVIAAAASVGASRPATAADASAPPLVRHSRRLELSAWAMFRGKPGDILGANSLAANGATLGGSQAGARINYWVTRHFAASLRTSAPLGGARGGEVAGGVRYQPWLSMPFSITAERRQRFGRTGGRNDFALFLEGGVWDRPMPLGFRLDAYAQAGVVGIRHHDLFGDGALTLTRPLWKNLSGGFGVWGGAQPHLYRLDAGPRLTIRMARSMRVHLDYRQRLAGTASPSSGPAVTIAGDF